MVKLLDEHGNRTVEVVEMPDMDSAPGDNMTLHTVGADDVERDVLLFSLEGPIGQYIASQLSNESEITGTFRATIQRDPDAYTYVIFEICEGETFPWDELSRETWGDVWPKDQRTEA